MLINILKLPVCGGVCNGRSAEAVCPQVKRWLISQLSNLQALLKAHATGLATGKNPNLLGMLNETEMEM